MSTLFDEMVNEEERRNRAWMKIAEEKGLVCERCGEPAPLSEETGRYLTGYCGICGHFFDKIMSE
jgi:ribosomal protein S27AE